MMADGLGPKSTHLAENFFRSTVKPTVEEFLSDPLNLRRGRLAAIVLYHMADYWVAKRNEGGDKKDNKNCLEKLHKQLIAECQEFNIIRDIADASKHARLYTQGKIPRIISSSEQITRRPGLFHAPFGVGVFNQASWVMVKMDDGSSRPLLDAIEAVMKMWEEMLNSNREGVTVRPELG
ncbi:hypothetical protein [Magnetospirillum molischianum]|uniref:Uncharacterized protein n=1 Tax=Magnetospirillum molischianum DSM 120 TaxID=1150626 RepID=H8FTX3_MAGML|nr:hypothetical protein [Magnetospirillum molischianum]CCG41830.1 hypothetical protein PHAMO_290118 [Magnetospirillum molischianum DSM 120]